MDKQLCASCGAPLPPGHPMALVLDTDLTGLAAMLLGELDEQICEVCGTPTGNTFTQIAVFHEPDEIWLVPGNRLGAAGVSHLSSALSEQFGQTPAQLPGIDDLRLKIQARLRSAVQPLNDYFAASDGNAFLDASWPRFRPAVFVAGILALEGVVPDVPLLARQHGDDESGVADVLADYGRLQGTVWLALCLAWMRPTSPERGPALESDLSRMVDDSLLLPGARERFDRGADALNARPDTDAETTFLLEAVRASIYALDEVDNPRASAWASYFLMQELALRKNPQAVSEKLNMMQISSARANNTISYRAAWDAVARELQRVLDESDRPRDERVAEMDLVRTVMRKAGHASVVNDVINHGYQIFAPDAVPLTELVAPLLPLSVETREEEIELMVFAPVAALLVRERRIEDLEKLADIALREMGPSRTAQARVEAWLGRYLKELREPRRLLQRIGPEPRPWEHDLPSSVRLNLWVERSNALRLLGRGHEALAAAQAALPLVDDEDAGDRRALRRNIAILLRETGAPDVALLEFQQLLAQAIDDQERLDHLESLATTYGELQQMEEAEKALEEALTLATGPYAQRAARLQTTRASVLAWLGRHDEAAAALQGMDPSQAGAQALLGEFATWLNIMNVDASLVPEDRFEHVATGMARLVQEAQEAGDVPTFLTALYATALFLQIAEDGDAVEMWLSLYEAHQEESVAQRPETLFWLAYHAYGRGEPDVGHNFLTQVPQALRAHVGGVADLALAVDSGRRLHVSLEKAAEQILFNPDAGATFRDVRLIAELGRDVVGRARASDSQPGNPALLAQGLSDEVVATLAPAEGRLAVVEWIATAEFAGRFITVINAQREVDSQWLMLPDIDEERLLRRLRSRLTNWLPGDAGDPFDLPEWHALERWLQETLAPLLEQDDHVVFIEPSDTAGMPWHVATAPRWTASYCASWSTLLALHRREIRPLRGIGVLAVPLYNDGEAIRAAFTQSVNHTRKLASDQNLELHIAEDREADKEAFIDILGSVDAAKLLCHGFAASGQVSLLVARNGALPPGNRVALAAEKGRPYRVAWRELQRLPSAPAVVFSAACSSGLATIAGQGERLGLYGALFPNGTRALVAPWWDIVAEAVLPLADEAFARYARGEGSLAAVLCTTCREASRELPRWLAWALAIEGDWR